MLTTAYLYGGIAGAAEATLEDRAHLHWVWQQVEIAAALDELSHRAITGFIVFKDISIVDPMSGNTLPGKTVATRDGKIAWVGDATAAPEGPVIRTSAVLDRAVPANCRASRIAGHRVERIGGDARYAGAARPLAAQSPWRR